jgi:hypothetical protein
MRKIDSQIIHAIRRLEERYGLLAKDYQALVEMIKYQNYYSGNNIKFVKRESKRRTVWKILYKSRVLKAVYDSKSGIIVTFLH